MWEFNYWSDFQLYVVAWAIDGTRLAGCLQTYSHWNSVASHQYRVTVTSLCEQNVNVTHGIVMNNLQSCFVCSGHSHFQHIETGIYIVSCVHKSKGNSFVGTQRDKAKIGLSQSCQFDRAEFYFENWFVHINASPAFRNISHYIATQSIFYRYVICILIIILLHAQSCSWSHRKEIFFLHVEV